MTILPRITGLALISLAMISFLIGCDSGVGGTDAGNPGTYSLYATGVDSIPNTGLQQRFGLTAGASITSARMVLGKIKFVSASDCDSESSELESELEGPFVVDLVNQNLVGSFSTNKTSFCRLELEMEKLQGSNRPSNILSSDPLIGKALQILGRRGDNTPFEISLEQSEEFKLRSGSNFSLEAAKIYLAFRFDEWFSDMDLEGADVTSGTIYINKDSNRDLFDQIVLNIQRSARLFEDRDRDGNLDSDESDDSDSKADGED